MVKKLNGNETVTLVEGNEVITDKGKLAQTLNEYFVNLVLSFCITSFVENYDDTIDH